ncbi:TolC family protein [bacterium]|nr:TolC family protein [bacterium]
MTLSSWLLAWLLFFSIALSAQDKRKLTVDEAIAIGIENSKSLHSSSQKVESAIAKTKEINGQRLPSLKLTAAYTRLSEVPAVVFNGIAFAPSIFNNYTIKTTVQQPLFTGFKLDNTYKATKLSEDASQLDYSKDKIDLTFNIRQAYWNLFKANEVKKVVDENVEQVRAHLKDAQNLYAQGLLTNNDVLKIQVQLSNTLLQQIDAKNGVQLAMIGLNNQLSLPLDTQIELNTSVDHQLKKLEEKNTLVQKGMTRQDVQAMELRVKAAEAGVKAVKGSWYPQIYAVGNFYYNRPNSRYFPTEDKFKDSWDVGINVTLDIWNWNSTSHQATQARSQVAQTKDALGLLKDGIGLEVTQNYLSVIQAKEKIAVSEESVKQAEESFRITSEKFKNGVALTSDVIDAEVSVLQAKTNYTQALVDYELALARLQKSIGE